MVRDEGRVFIRASNNMDVYVDNKKARREILQRSQEGFCKLKPRNYFIDTLGVVVLHSYSGKVIAWLGIVFTSDIRGAH